MTTSARRQCWFSMATGMATVGLLSACAAVPRSAENTRLQTKGMKDGTVYTLTTCPLSAAMVCEIVVSAKPPTSARSGDCTMELRAAAIIPKQTQKLVWSLKSVDPAYEFQFRQGSNKHGSAFGILLIDNKYFESTAADNAPIWVPSAPTPAQVEMTRASITFPPRISAYDILVEYRADKTNPWTQCDNWDPMIINRD